MTMGMAASAQKTDGFFSNYDNGFDGRGTDMPALPNTEIGNTGNVSAPIGSGLLILTALGAGYALKKKRD